MTKQATMPPSIKYVVERDNCVVCGATSCLILNSGGSWNVNESWRCRSIGSWAKRNSFSADSRIIESPVATIASGHVMNIIIRNKGVVQVGSCYLMMGGGLDHNNKQALLVRLQPHATPQYLRVKTGCLSIRASGKDAVG